MADNRKSRDKLLAIVRDLIRQDDALRKELGLGEKFVFIRNSISSLLQGLEAELAVLKEATEPAEVVISADDVNVYVYVFNALGLDLASWKKMVSPDVYYEYSVSRPIYLDKTHVEKFIDSKPTRTQHGFITVAVKKDAILPADGNVKDAMGNQLIKVKEGALQFKRVISFTHNNVNYKIGAKGELNKVE